MQTGTMTMTRLIAKFRATCSQTWRRFGAAQGGNTVVVFALAAIPLVGLTGAAVDYSRASAIRTTMQAAADATALAMAQNAAADTDLTNHAQNYFNGLFTRKDAPQPVVTTSYTTTNGATVVVQASTTYPTSFMGVLGAPFKKIPLNVIATSTFGNTRLRVAHVLDTTGSMASAGKLTALQNALTNTTNGLLAQLKSAAINPGDVYVSIVPFVKDVNAGSTNNTANWIYWDDAAKTDTTSWDANNGSCSRIGNSTRSACLAAQGTCSISGNTTQNTCTQAGNCSISGNSTQNSCTAAGTCSFTQFTTQNTCTAAAGSCNITSHTTKSTCQSAAVCSDTSRTNQTSCVNHGGTWTVGVWTAGPGVWTSGTWTAGVWSSPTWTPNAHSTWNGCITDRGGPTAPDAGNYDVNTAAASTATPASLFPAEQYGSCPQPVMGLTYNWNSMTSLVNSLSANGNTNQAVGLAWGWLSLVGGGPFTVPTMDPNYKYQQVIILLSDGLNTQDRWYGTDMCGAIMCIDAREKLICDNIKDSGVTIYTIQVNTDAEATSNVLKYCAGTVKQVGDPNKFFLLTSSTQIVTTFQTIGTALSQLRISK